MNKNDSKFIDDYLRLLDSLPSHLKVSKLYDDIHCIASRVKNHSNKKVALVALTHGDEVIGLHIFIKLLEQLISGKFILDGELILVIANKAAYLVNQRYTESDLNRAYGQSEISTLEGSRSRVIKAIVDECDYIIDIHQCIEDTLHPFFILPFSKESYLWIATVAPRIPIIIKNNIVEATTLSSYGFLSGKKSVTFEAGSRGFDNSQLEFGYNTIKSFLQFAWQKEKELEEQKQTVASLAFEIKHFQPYQDGAVRFAKLFKNFEDIKQGQVIAYLNEKPIHTPITGKILLYPRKWFAKSSSIKADGIFFVLQSFEIP